MQSIRSKRFDERESEAKIYYLIGEDNVSGLASWHRFELAAKVDSLCRSRPHGAQAKSSISSGDRKIEISATELRKRMPRVYRFAIWYRRQSRKFLENNLYRSQRITAELAKACA